MGILVACVFWLNGPRFQLGLYLKPRPQDLVVLPGKGLFYLDAKAKRVVWIDEKTLVPKVVVQEGQGPGEIVNLATSHLAASEYLVVLAPKWGHQILVQQETGVFVTKQVGFLGRGLPGMPYVCGPSFFWLSCAVDANPVTFGLAKVNLDQEEGRLLYEMALASPTDPDVFPTLFPTFTFHRSLTDDRLFWNLDDGHNPNSNEIKVYNLRELRFEPSIRIQSAIPARNGDFPEVLAMYQRQKDRNPALKMAPIQRTPFVRSMRSGPAGELIVKRQRPGLANVFETYDSAGKRIENAPDGRIFDWIVGYDGPQAYVLGYDTETYSFFVQKMPFVEVSAFYSDDLLKALEEY
ncbi:MAG: hypothetical protein H6510_06770 [Acidobacteria bacterium]|nr:hypothetical protein [Acidobacteriota bacterium]MCB9397498.1 hypothetical protein [Acidobacteriota bacterium]